MHGHRRVPFLGGRYRCRRLSTTSPPRAEGDDSRDVTDLLDLNFDERSASLGMFPLMPLVSVKSRGPLAHAWVERIALAAGDKDDES